MARAREEIAKFQQVLVNSGYGLPKYGVDGKWGNETKTAMNQYLADRGREPKELPDNFVVMLMNSEMPLRGDGITIDYNRLINAINSYLAEKRAEIERVEVPTAEEGAVQPPEVVPPPMPTPKKKGFPTWGWILIGLGGVAFIGSGVALYMYLKKRQPAYTNLSDLSCPTCDYDDMDDLNRYRPSRFRWSSRRR